MRYEYFIGLRYLRAKRRQTFVSVITAIAVAGVAVGVAALIIVLSGMVGVQEYMRDKILGFNAHLIVSAVGDEIADPEAVMKKLRAVPRVTGASPFIEGQIMLKGPNRNEGVMLRAIDPGTFKEVMTISGATMEPASPCYCLFKRKPSDFDLEPGLKRTEQRGSLQALAAPLRGPEDLPGIAIGKDLAASLGVFYGEELSVIVPEGVLTPLGMRPKVKRFRIACIFNFGFYEVDSTVALMSLPSARALLNREAGAADGIEVKTDDIYTVAKIKQAVDAALGPEYYSTTWFQQQKQLFAALKMEQLLSVVVLSLIMLVAAFNIVSMLLMVVMEKYRDIAILKTMGATDGGIMRVFITQGMIIGVGGALLGVALGLFVCWLQNRCHYLAFDPAIYQFSDVPMKVVPLNVIAVALGAMAVSFLTTLYPSWQAARMKPAESLRYE
jgi:lipoprotein-releasing system permease protein